MAQFGNEELVDTVIETEFLVYMLEKVNNDNNWLVDKLAEYGQANDLLQSRRQIRKPDLFVRKVWADIRQTSDALREFEESRGRLIEKFGEKR